jgi:hypothetical protein
MQPDLEAGALLTVGPRQMRLRMLSLIPNE